VTVYDEVYTLDPWQEATGTLLAIDHCSVSMVLKLLKSTGDIFTARILMDEGTRDLVQAELNDSLVGKRVAVLVTDIPERPVIVRVLEDEYVTPDRKEIRVTQPPTTTGGVTHV